MGGAGDAGTLMWRSHAFSMRTRRGKVRRVVRERYLRDDIACLSRASDEGAAAPSTGGPPSGGPGTDLCRLSARPYHGRYLVLDTNVVLHQIDLLERSCPALCDVVILGTVLEETKHRK